MPNKKPGRSASYPLAARLQAKALYLACKSYEEIFSATGIPRDYLRKYQNREGWHKLRQSPEQRSAALDTVNKALEEFQQQVATESQSLTLDSLPVVRDAISRGSARDLKDSAQGLKTLYEIARLSSGMDSKQDAKGGATAGVNMFFFSGVAARAELPVTPPQLAIDIAEPIFDEPDFGD